MPLCLRLSVMVLECPYDSVAVINKESQGKYNALAGQNALFFPPLPQTQRPHTH